MVEGSDQPHQGSFQDEHVKALADEDEHAEIKRLTEKLSAKLEALVVEINVTKENAGLAEKENGTRVKGSEETPRSKDD